MVPSLPSVQLWSRPFRITDTPPVVQWRPERHLLVILATFSIEPATSIRHERYARSVRPVQSIPDSRYATRPDPYLAHEAMPAAEPATAEYAAAQAGFGQTLAVRLWSWPGRSAGRGDRSARAGMCSTEAGGTYPFPVRLSERVSIKPYTPT